MSSIAIRGKNKGADGLVTTTTSGNKELLDVAVVEGSAGGGGATGGGLSTYYAKPSGTNADATSAYASATTLTVTGLPYSFTKYDIVSIRQIPNSGGSGAQDTVFSDVADFSVSGTTITVTGATFAATDEFVVAFVLPPKSIDETNDTQSVSRNNPDYHRNTDAFSLISSAQTLTASFADVGAEINAKGYKYVYYYVTVDINNSNDVRLKFLAKHESGGSEEYVMDHALINASDTALSATDDYIEVATDADQLIIVRVPVDNAIPFVQMQASVGTAGATAADLDAVRYSLGY